ncbi:DUF4479 domain-containing protein, partial [Lactobacillus sp. XV13L]|nr:DUF4479 domain-containing protein [Lactobacillus sp. XV13L]
MITSINKRSYPGTLIVILGQDHGKTSYEKKGDITRITDEEGNVTGYNFFNVDQVIDYNKLPDGQVKLSDSDLAALNKQLKATGFDDQLEYGKPTLVYGYVKTCEKHP